MLKYQQHFKNSQPAPPCWPRKKKKICAVPGHRLWPGYATVVWYQIRLRPTMSAELCQWIWLTSLYAHSQHCKQPTAHWSHSAQQHLGVTMKFENSSCILLMISARLFDTSTITKLMHHPNSLRNLESTLASPVGKELHMTLVITFNIHTYRKNTIMHHPNSLRNLESTLASPIGKELHMTLVITFNIHTYRKNTTQSPSLIPTHKSLHGNEATQSPCTSSSECSPNLTP